MKNESTSPEIDASFSPDLYYRTIGAGRYNTESVLPTFLDAEYRYYQQFSFRLLDSKRYNRSLKILAIHVMPVILRFS